MGITVDYLNEERVKLWTELEKLKKELSEAIDKLSQTDKATNSSIQCLIQSLEDKIVAVKKIADEKTPEDVQTASRAAQDVIKIKSDTLLLYKEVEEYRGRLSATETDLKRIEEVSNRCDTLSVEADGNRAKIIEAKKNIDTYVAEIATKRATTDEMIVKISTAATTSVEKAQEISNLKAQVGNATSEISATKQKIQELQTSLTELKEKQEAVLKESKEILGTLSSENQNRFEELYVTSKEQIKELEERIDKLLPGATSLSLSTAFGKRKKEVEKGKLWWVLLLIGSAGGIVTFGIWSLLQMVGAQAGEQVTAMQLSTVPIRLMIIAGLVIIEEFARRNYNVVSRLAEAYAYKEAIAQSYVGFKKELSEIDLPPRGEGNVVKSIGVLAETFLQKIGDEPGKKVFDKEKPALGVVQAISKMSGQEEPPMDKTQIVATATTVLSKISWPIVALVTVLAITVCIIVWLILRV